MTVERRNLILTDVGTAALGCPPGAARQCSQYRLAHAEEIDPRSRSVCSFSHSCSPRDFLTRRLATDLISASDAFQTPQQFILQTGIVSNKDYVSPEYLVLQQHGWISATTARLLSRPGAAALLGRSADSLGRGHGSSLGPRRRSRQALALHSRREEGTR